MEEEFENFLVQVNRVESIVQKLVSSEKNLQKIGTLEADQYLGGGSTQKDPKEPLRVKSDRTIINKATDLNPQVQFMKEIEKDAEKRYQDKKVRLERMQTLKQRGNTAFRKGLYEKALNAFNQAIELIRDSGTLYINRALTYIQLDLYQSALDDLQMALKRNEKSLKALLLKVKCEYRLGRFEDSQRSIDQVKKWYQHDPNLMRCIEEFLVRNSVVPPTL